MPVNIYGGGARTNANGLRFEQETSLEEALLNAGYSINDMIVGVIKILIHVRYIWQKHYSKMFGNKNHN